MTLRLTRDELDTLVMYGKITHNNRSQIIHEFIQQNMVKMLLFINRHEAEEEIKNDPHAADWTTDLPDVAQGKKGE
jgi:predicted deacetylase